MMSLEESADRLALQQLAIEYSNAIDAGQWDRLDDVFMPDAWIDYSAVGGLAGRYPEIKTWLADSLKMFGGYTHFVGNFEYSIQGDSATGQVACINPMVLPGLIPGLKRTMIVGVWYLDEYIRTAEGWRIQKRSERKAYTMNEPLWMKLGTRIYARFILPRRSKKQRNKKAVY